MSVFFFSSRRRHTRCGRDWSSDVCSSDLRVGNGYRLSRHKRSRSYPGLGGTYWAAATTPNLLLSDFRSERGDRFGGSEPQLLDRGSPLVTFPIISELTSSAILAAESVGDRLHYDLGRGKARRGH